jgi:3-deoxy-D-manno-octulosonic acid kinase
LDTLSQIFHSGYCFGSHAPLSSLHISKLTRLLSERKHTAKAVLEGRVSISRIELDGIGAVVVKHYRRGGMLARLISKTYLKVGKPRSQLEYEQMRMAGRLGIRTPEPIAYAYKGRFFYSAWLVTREVVQAISMAQVSRIAPERAAEAMHALSQQVDLLVAKRLRHADFHPGNVLVDHRNQVYIIDFDKAGLYRGRQADLRNIYRRRWCRAVHKHGLPPILCELFEA